MNPYHYTIEETFKIIEKLCKKKQVNIRNTCEKLHQKYRKL